MADKPDDDVVEEKEVLGANELLAVELLLFSAAIVDVEEDDVRLLDDDEVEG